MVYAPPWTEAEIAIVAESHGKSVEELRQELPQRSEGGIEAVRVGIHYFHEGKDFGFLSKRAQNYLKRKSGTLTCSHCNENF